MQKLSILTIVIALMASTVCLAQNSDVAYASLKGARPTCHPEFNWQLYPSVSSAMPAQTTDAPVVKFGSTAVASGNISVQTVQALANSGITIFPAPPVALSPKGFRVSIKSALGVNKMYDSENGKVSLTMKKALMDVRTGDVVTLSEVGYSFGGSDKNMPPMTFTVK